MHAICDIIKARSAFVFFTQTKEITYNIIKGRKMVKEILDCRDMCIGYDGCRLCSDINFTLREGEYMCVVGHSGIGKTCFAQTLLGTVPPVDGEVIYKDNLTRDEIGYVPQNDDIRGSSSVRDVVLSGCISGMKHFFITRAEKSLADGAMERLRITNLSKKRFAELSGGQKQRVLLARAMCGKRRLLILDEPMHGLDAVAKDEIFSEIAKINRDEKTAVIIIDHEAIDGTVLHLSDRQLYCGDVENYIKSVPGQFYFAGRII